MENFRMVIKSDRRSLQKKSPRHTRAYLYSPVVFCAADAHTPDGSERPKIISLKRIVNSRN